MWDKNLLFRDGDSAGNLTATFTSSSIDFGGPDVRPLTYQVVAPSASGTSPTLDAKVQVSDDNSTWRDAVTMKQLTTKGVRRATAVLDARYRRMVLTVGGTSPNFGAVFAGVVTGGEYDEQATQ